MFSTIGKAGSGRGIVNSARVFSALFALAGGVGLFACSAAPAEQPAAESEAFTRIPKCTPDQTLECDAPDPSDCDPWELPAPHKCPKPPPPVCTCVPKQPPQAVAVAAGANSTYAIKPSSWSATTGTVYAWGSNTNGALARPTGTGTDSYTPVAVALPAAAAKIAAAQTQACAVLTDGSVYCWGLASFDASIVATTPTKVVDINNAPLTNVVGVAVGGTSGSSFACAWTSAGAGYCWGDNDVNQLGNGMPDQFVLQATQVLGQDPVTKDVGAPLSDVAQIALAGNSACYLSKAGAVYCWGDNTDGQSATGISSAGTNFAYPSGQTGIASLMGGGDRGTYCVATIAPAGGSSTTLCWGANEYGEAGDGKTDLAYGPTTTLAAVIAPVVFGGQTACHFGAVTSCWGNGLKGQLADGVSDATPALTPVTVAGLGGIGSLALGGSHGCASTSTSLLCWGSNDKGQLGIGVSPGIHGITSVSF